MTDKHVVGYDGMWAKPGDDPRVAGNPVGELATIREYLSHYRLTLGMKCEDLSPEQLLATLSLARRDENCGPGDLPLLFRVDQDLRVRGAKRYLLDRGGRGECFEAPGMTCLQHLSGAGKRVRERGLRGFAPLTHGGADGGGACGGGGD